MERPWCSRHGECLRIAVHVQPNASRTEIAGLVEGALKIRLHAPPVDGKANEALTQFIAERLKVAKRDVTVSRGHGSRQKLLEVRTGMTLEQIESLLSSLTHQKL
ncbi:MAG: hypothetical protein RIR21_1929 [Pseudomonadota bacterium]|jgi:uncharacterized protein (TIGR00251 family)